MEVRTNDRTLNTKLEVKYILTSIVISLANIIFYNNKELSMAIVTLEVLILIFLLIRNNFIEYICFYLIFMVPSLEFSAFISEDTDVLFYGFKNFRIAGVNLGVIFVLLPFLYILIFKKLNFKFAITEYPSIVFLLKVLFFFAASSTIIGLLNVLFNDNSIQNLDDYMKIYINQAYTEYWSLMLLVIILYTLMYEEKSIVKLENTLVSILISSSVTIVFSSLANFKGSYGALEILLIPTISWLLPVLLVFPLYSYRKSIKYTMFFLGIIGSVLLLNYNANGKVILLIFFLIMFGIFGYARKNINARLLPAVILLVLFFSSFGMLMEYFSTESQLFKNKLTQAIGLISFWKENWIENMPTSPRFRITELLNIGIEYINKPWQVILGKGYLGSIRDHLNAFGWNVAGAFTQSQYINNSFYRLHETINVVFLRNGIVGIVLLAILLKKSLFRSTSNVWLLIGGIWLFLYYGFSLTLGAFGLTSLIIGFVLFDKAQNRKNSG